MNKIYKLGELRAATHEASIFIGYRGHFWILPNPIEKTKRAAKRIKRFFFNLFFTKRVDVDCDGSTVSIHDRLTDGSIYRFHGWNFTRAGGSYGCTTEILGREVKRA